MPIIERDPWRMQYFEGVHCPSDVVIPTDDEHAYALYPAHRWVYDKLRICETQGLPAAPHGVPPGAFPVFSKPIYNLHGMGTGSRVIRTREDLAQHEHPGHLWMPLLHGEHVSSDVIVIDGTPRWWRHAVGTPLGDGCFDHWSILAESRPALEGYCGDWVGRHLRGYTGAVNIETIGGRIIEVHLRFADQWPDLYGPGWLPAVVTLYAAGVWTHREERRRDGYSVVLFGPHGRRYFPPRPAVLDGWRRQHGISSIQITFDPSIAPSRHAMPPGGFRLAVINCFQLTAGLAVRDRLAAEFRVQSPGAVQHDESYGMRA
jgi:hypothetical protein